MAFVKNIITIGCWTILSRITGLMREMLVANYLGAGIIADAFFVALRFPNMFRALFAEGAFNSAFIPMFTSKLKSFAGIDTARQFAEQCLAVLIVVLISFIVVIEIGMPWFIYIQAYGFEDTPGKLALTIEFSRITFPYLLFISVVSLQSGVLNAMGHFAVAAGTPVLFNITSMAVMIALVPYVETAGHAIAWGIFVSGVVQFLWLITSVHRINMRLRLVKPRILPEVKVVLSRIVPGAVGAGVYQVNLFINTIIASNISNGAVSYLNYADRINQLPLGIVGIAISTALLPLLSRQVSIGNTAGAIESQNRAMEIGMLLTLPATVAFLIIPHSIVAVLFERGSFTEIDTMAVTSTLMAFAIGLPAYVLIKVLTLGFFARQDTKTPMKITIVTMVINIGLNLVLMVPFAYVGMALSTAIVSWLNVIILIWILKRRDYFIVDKRLVSRVWRTLLSCLFLACILIGVNLLLKSLLYTSDFRILALCFLVIIGICSFVLITIVTGAIKFDELKVIMRKKN